VFSIAKYTLFAKLRKRGKEVPNEQIDQDAVFEPSYFGDEEESEDLRNAMNQLSEGCRKVLVLFYYRRYTIEAIMHTLNYKNENTAKANKSRCLKKLREIMKGNI
jgi:DNA-directed RNA polymerase specialized sigma24 family protein